MAKHTLVDGEKLIRDILKWHGAETPEASTRVSLPEEGLIKFRKREKSLARASDGTLYWIKPRGIRTGDQTPLNKSPGGWTGALFDPSTQILRGMGDAINLLRPPQVYDPKPITLGAPPTKQKATKKKASPPRKHVLRKPGPPNAPGYNRTGQSRKKLTIK